MSPTRCNSYALAPDARRWLDLGSGAGFPGLVLGIAALERPGMSVGLVESNGRKCAFLRHVARLTGAPVTIHEGRAETLLPGLTGVDVVTARAFAPLPQLLAVTRGLLTTGTLGLFPKGPRRGRRIDRGGEILDFRCRAPAESD